MNEAIGQILSFGVVVAISPFPVIAVVLVLATPRARVNGPAFLLGWVVGLTALGTVVLLVSSGVDASDDGEPATWVSLLKLVLGALLLGLAVQQWRGRRAGSGKLPKWMQAIDHMSAVKVVGMAAALSLNPKNFVVVVGAAATIAQTGISASEQAIALAVLVLIGSLGVMAPLGVYFGLGSRSAKPLDAIRSWMAANNSAVVAVMLLVIGTNLLGDGISGL
jgi:Sap, sulfolipid-1-addressing protein